MPSNTLSGCGACGTAPGSGTTDDHDRATGTDGSGTVTGLRSDLVRPTVTGPQRDRMCNRITSHARQYDYRLVRAAPRHPANASRHAKKFRVPLTVPELVKQKIAGSRASGVGSDFVIDDGTGRYWWWWLVSRSEANHL